MKHDFFIVGDSNAAAIARGARLLGYNFLGGPVTAGANMISPFCEINNNKFVLLGGIPCLKERVPIFERIISERIPVLSTVGFHPRLFCLSAIKDRTVTPNENNRIFISNEVFTCCMNQFSEGSIHFYEKMIQNNVDIYAVHAPQRINDIFVNEARLYEKYLISKIESIGVKILDVKNETCDDNGFLRKEYFPEDVNDPTHANDEYGKVVIGKFKQTLDDRNTLGTILSGG